MQHVDKLPFNWYNFVYFQELLTIRTESEVKAEAHFTQEVHLHKLCKFYDNINYQFAHTYG